MLNNISMDKTFLNLSDIESTAKNVYNELTDEAKLIFENYLIKNPDMYELHSSNVSPNLQIQSIPLSEANSLLNSASLQSTLTLDMAQNLSNNLDLIVGLSTAVKYALMGVSSSIVALSSTITVAQLVGLLVAAGCLAVLVANWDNVNTYGDQIINAFKLTFN